MITEKLCNKCNSIKPISEFYIQLKTKDGYRPNCKECLSLIHKEKYKNLNEIEKNNYIQNRLKWKKENKDKVKIYNRTQDKKRRKQPIHKIKHNLRQRIKELIINPGSISEKIGCSGQFLKKYLESKFYGIMSWDNYGSIWHVDHIKPLCLFDLTNPEELKKANHYTNLQPLLKEDNLKKGSKYNSSVI